MNAAKALLYQKKIPDYRLKELRAILVEFYDLVPGAENNEISNDILMDAVNLEIANRRGKVVSHGLKVVSSLTSPVSLVNFEVMWREHFVKQMQPKFLPVGWDTHHRIDRYSVMSME